MKLKERLQKLRSERKEVMNINKTMNGLQIQIDNLIKKISGIDERQKTEKDSIFAEYNLEPESVDSMIDEKDNKIYNSIAEFVNVRWQRAIEDYQKTVNKYKKKS
jgi:hypothetical protein